MGDDPHLSQYLAELVKQAGRQSDAVDRMRADGTMTSGANLPGRRSP